jgi:hypothetical protein
MITAFLVLAINTSAAFAANDIGPCAKDDIERVKAMAVAAIAASESGLMYNITKESFKHIGVFTTSADDAAVLSMSAHATMVPPNGNVYFVSVQAICSPSTGRYELMSISIGN